ncbi:single-stranded-DNA-specific exonuclease RecJ [Staphylococcus nepalensis]|uniref:Single-stranded-DNA-specific exonuclease RecJ n=1 Tax=Staphylococcus nepalensis TaxID=214473 RepID=A0ABS3KXT2_9STAP|nr:single-stranded-DNA-specific exonuclease RecJ [Staphylococcus nepalensis]MBO1213317.1 single-stranded-DNA-specific exonuclease RecJ [Staphylococcus nepalensis]MBO1215461.1 single-stranded-DNA-specific exonuclease RecJ [Staphylococcus nepalensis]MBO1226103.1 single-stranded-DNA-specific exonuclease RecJ [Staphylococcus nepalensis]MBO1234531.1 single-stranded-DNA-specific exonuclease RecJ [Staphylococcus nepalensis]MBO1236747.1 single-stranded-DNA-specific exonuclease RecJ [Staphylococcus nep
MIKSKYNWDVKLPEVEITEDVSTDLKLTPIVKKILESKGITEETAIRELLNGTQIAHDPWTMSDMHKAVERINLAIDQNQKILVYGDYDADGVTSTTILVSTLKALGAHVGWYIPNRFSEGYGPNEMAFKNAYEEGISLIITVDNGIQGHDEIQMIQELGVDVIVTDHHEIGRTMPNAYAIVHPMHPGFDYPFKYLCGAGVAYKLAQCLLTEPPTHFLGLVAIGTIADLVSLTDENRSLVQRGLDALNQHCPLSIKAILKQAGCNDEINEETVGFVIGPRLNAVGRLEDAALAVELLMTETEEEAEFLAEQVEFFNQERKDIVSQITEEALVMAEQQVQDGSKFLLLAQPDWHEGVLGIVASKIVETYSLPTLILNIDQAQNHAKGSARSIDQVSMFEILSAHSELISKFGGHHMAAGVTMPIENIQDLQHGLNDWMAQLAETTSLEPWKKVDVKILESDITIKNIKDIHRLRPFGTDFSSPCFELQDIIVQQAKGIGQDKNHLKLVLGDSQLQAIFWQNGYLVKELGVQQPINLIGTLQINEWNGFQSPQFMVADLASNNLQILDYRSKRKVSELNADAEDVAYLIHKKSEKLGENYYYYGDDIINKYDKYVFRDLPTSITELKTTLKTVDVSQIYLVLNHERSIYFEGMPKMETFKQCFKALASKKETNLAKEGMQLSQFLNIQPSMLKFILKVFLDLEFIKDENGIIMLNSVSTKRDIATSKYYQNRLDRIEVEKLLLYEDFNRLKQWFKAELVE